MCVLSTHGECSQHLGMQWCHQAIIRSETRRQVRYAQIIFSRPDLVWWRPLPSFCELPANAKRSMLSCDKPGCDMAWAAPRVYLDRLLRQADMHRDCTETGPPPHGASRARNVRLLASCCSTSEWLLWFAQSSRALGATAPSTTVVSTSAPASTATVGTGGLSADALVQLPADTVARRSDRQRTVSMDGGEGVGEGGSFDGGSASAHSSAPRELRTATTHTLPSYTSAWDLLIARSASEGAGATVMAAESSQIQSHVHEHAQQRRRHPATQLSRSAGRAAVHSSTPLQGLHAPKGSDGSSALALGEIPVHRLAAFEPDRGGHFTLLRDVSGACERALAESYTNPGIALRLQLRSGLSVATGNQLRRHFGAGNFTACRSALGVTMAPVHTAG